MFLDPIPVRRIFGFVTHDLIEGTMQSTQSKQVELALANHAADCTDYANGASGSHNPCNPRRDWRVLIAERQQRKRVAVLGWGSYVRVRSAVGFSEESIRKARAT
jgi:hypothetical protein